MDLWVGSLFLTFCVCHPTVFCPPCFSMRNWLFILLRCLLHGKSPLTGCSQGSLFVFEIFPIWCGMYRFMGFPGGSDGKVSACNAGGLGSIPELGRSPGEGHGNPLQYSCLENPHGQRSLVGYSPWGRKSWTWLSE